MNCNQIKEQVYEWSNGTLSEKDRPAVEEHLRDCQSCQAYEEQVKHTLSLLNEIKPPLLSVDFKERLLMRSRDIPLPYKPLWQLFKDWFQIPYIKWPLEGLAATAVILIALVVYKDVSFKKPSKTEMTPRSLQMEFPETLVKHPIIIQTKDLNKTLSALNSLIRDNDGRIIQTLPQDQEIRITLNLNKKNETVFLAQVKNLGRVEMEQSGYLDEAGKMVVILKLER